MAIYLYPGSFSDLKSIKVAVCGEEGEVHKDKASSSLSLSHMGQIHTQYVRQGKKGGDEEWRAKNLYLCHPAAGATTATTTRL